MSQLDDFLITTFARRVEEEEALLNGDVIPRLEMWSTQERMAALARLIRTSMKLWARLWIFKQAGSLTVRMNLKTVPLDSPPHYILTV